MKINISTHAFTDKNKIEWKKVNYREKDITTISLLDWYLKKGYSFCGIFRHTGDILIQHEKAEKNFIQTNVISVDLDDCQKPYEEFVSIMAQTDIKPSLTYTTANNGIKGNRYRALYVTDTPITDIDTYKALYKGISKEISLHTGQRITDNCGERVHQQMAGNSTPTYKSTLGDIWSLKELGERYNVNVSVSPNAESITPLYNKEGNNSNGKVFTRLYNKGIEESSNAESATRLYISEGNDSNSESATSLYNRNESNTNGLKVQNRYIIGKMLYESATSLYNKEKEEKRNIIYPYCTFEDIEKLPFIKDYYTMSVYDLVSKYSSTYHNIEATPIEFENDELYKILPSDYMELKRGGYFYKDERDRLQWKERIRKDGEGRKKHIFLNLLIRRMIEPTITFDNLLWCALYELCYYNDNSNGTISKHDIAQITVNAFVADISEWQKLREYNKKVFKVNKEYCKRNGLKPKEEALKIIANLKKGKTKKRNERIKELYKIELTDKENIEDMKKNGLKICLRTLKNWKKANGIKKYKGKATANTNKAIAQTPITECVEMSRHTDNNALTAKEMSKTDTLQAVGMTANTSTEKVTDISRPAIEKAKTTPTEKTNKAIASENNTPNKEMPTPMATTQQGETDDVIKALNEVCDNCQTIDDVIELNLKPYMSYILKDIVKLMLKAEWEGETINGRMRYLFQRNYNAYIIQINQWMKDDCILDEEKAEIKHLFEKNRKRLTNT